MPTNVEVPSFGESVTEATLLKWHKNDGDFVAVDEPLCEFETDKANTDITAQSAGILKRLKAEGAKVKVGETIATLDPAGKPAAKAEAPKAAIGAVAPEKKSSAAETLSPAVRRITEENKVDPSTVAATGPGGRLTKEDVVNHLDKAAPATKPAKDVDPGEATLVISQQEKPAAQAAGDGTRHVPMSKIRKRIAENLVRAQQTAAILTTFNEIDLQAVMDLRTKYKEKFEKAHGIGLGFMSFFAKATVMALKQYERVNASLDGDDIVFHDYVHLGIAVSTERGLAVPVLRNADKMSFAKIESEIKRLATATRDGKLALNELSGGTFTITNGGVFGSLLSTPIINSPQSGILGMHSIQKRAVVVNDKVEIRPMMYVALSYDHRMVDGRESVSFLVRIKELLEDPARLMLEV